MRAFRSLDCGATRPLPSNNITSGQSQLRKAWLPLEAGAGEDEEHAVAPGSLVCPVAIYTCAVG